MIDSTKKMYTTALENQIQRNLTLIPPNVIMKNGKKYSEINPISSKVGLSQTSSKDSIPSIENPKKAPLQKTKSQTHDLPKMRETKPQQKIQEPAKKPALKKEKLPAKKLQIQSDSEDIYEPQQFMEVIGNKPVYKGEPMELEISDNHKENHPPTAQKPERQQNEENSPQENKNSPGNNTNADEEDSMDMDEMMKLMNQEAKKTNQKPSIGAKSLPAVKQTKLQFGKPQATKSVATKQGSILGWMGKK